jgi:histidinol phosphatase-like PHP family hydrolase
MSTNERQKNLAINGTFDLPLDVHLHTLLSPDSAVPVDVYPALAIALGMPRIAITDHLDFDHALSLFCAESALQWQKLE